MKNKEISLLVSFLKDVPENLKNGYRQAIDDLLFNYANELCDVWSETNADNLHQDYVTSLEENGEAGDPDYYCDIEIDSQRVRERFC
jgi:hypothetical protein